MNERAQKLYEEHKKNWNYICKRIDSIRWLFLVGIIGMIVGAFFWRPLWFASLIFMIGDAIYRCYWVLYRMGKCLKCWDKIDELEN